MFSKLKIKIKKKFSFIKKRVPLYQKNEIPKIEIKKNQKNLKKVYRSYGEKQRLIIPTKNMKKNSTHFAKNVRQQLLIYYIIYC